MNPRFLKLRTQLSNAKTPAVLVARPKRNVTTLLSATFQTIKSHEWQYKNKFRKDLLNTELRCFSSDKLTTATMETRWRVSTKSLLDRDVTELGSFDSLKWHLAETMLVYWSEQGPDGLANCFLILERLAEEAAANTEAKFTLDIYIVHAVLKAWNRLFRKFKVNHLPSQVLKRLEGCLSKSRFFEPNIATFSIILDGCCYCPNPAERLNFTEHLLGRLLEESETNPLVRPTTVTFSTVINAWARSGSVTAAEKAEALFRNVQGLDENEWPDVKPNSVMYTSVIYAWANAGRPDRAESLLKEMYEDYVVHRNSEVKPNEISFNTVLTAWSKSPSPDAVDSAEALLRKMIELNERGLLESKPSVISYNCLLHTLARSRGYPETVAKAETLFEEMSKLAMETGDKSMEPNLISYTALFKILGAARDTPDIAAITKKWIDKAEEKGFSDEPFLRDQFQTISQRNMKDE